MLFHITQTHTPENCPKEAGGSKTLYDSNVEGVKLLAVYGAFAQHVIYYIVEANTPQAIHKFLYPGFNSCTATIGGAERSADCAVKRFRGGASLPGMRHESLQFREAT